MPAPQRADVAGEVGHGGRLRLGQVVAFGIVGQRHLHDVEGADVGLVALGPRHPHPHDRPRRQVHDGRVLERGGQDEQVEGGAARGGHALLAPGRAPSRRAGSVGVLEAPARGGPGAGRGAATADRVAVGSAHRLLRRSLRLRALAHARSHSRPDGSSWHSIIVPCSRCHPRLRDRRRSHSCDERLQLPGQRLDVGGRRPARARLADVGQSRLGRAPLEERPVVGLAPGDHRGREPCRRTSASRSGRSPVTTISLRPLHMGSAATRSASAAGCRSRSGRARVDGALDGLVDPRVVRQRVGAQQCGDRDGVGRRERPRRGTPWDGRRVPRRRCRS